MIRTFYAVSLALLLALSSPTFADIDSINFEGLRFPLDTAWSNLTVIDSGFGLRTDNSHRPTGPGTFSVIILHPEEYLIELEDGSTVSLVSLLVGDLTGKTPDEKGQDLSPLTEAFLQSFLPARRVDHEALEVYVETEPYLPDTFKAYIIRQSKNPIEISATMSLSNFENYLRTIRRTAGQ